jgi:methionyl-tRNA synthetase
VYWPIMLHALGLPLPRGILVHGWWLQSGAKMSKSTGGAVDPLALVAEFGVDAFRYFLIREMNVGQDSEFSRELFLARYTGDLANDLGNLVNRTLNMTNRFSGGVIPAAEAAGAAGVDGVGAGGAGAAAGGEPEAELRARWAATQAAFIPLCEEFQFHSALERLFTFVRAINAYIERRAPWKLGKSAAPEDQALLRTALATMAEALRLAANALRPVMPGTADRIAAVLGGAEAEAGAGTWAGAFVWGDRLAGARVAASLVLFPKPAP